MAAIYGCKESDDSDPDDSDPGDSGIGDSEPGDSDPSLDDMFWKRVGMIRLSTTSARRMLSRSVYICANGDIQKISEHLSTEQ